MPESPSFLMPSPYLGDGGVLIGRNPADLPVAELRELGHPESPGRAIRAKCLDCCGGNAAEVRKCTAVLCPLWPMRMGRNPFWGLQTPRIAGAEPDAADGPPDPAAAVAEF